MWTCSGRATSCATVDTFRLQSHRSRGNVLATHTGLLMSKEADVRQGMLALMVLKTLEMLGPLHGYGIARRIEHTSGDRLSLNYGTLYPALLKLEQEGYIASEWGLSENNRKAKYYRLTRAGQKQLAVETGQWKRVATAIAFALEAT